jgi:predicted phosphodiesterase
MTQILIAGDLHGKYGAYSEILTQTQPDRSIQIGDFGWGFRPDSQLEKSIDNFMTAMPGDHQYFRGNHDDPVACAQHDLCLPDIHYEPDTQLMITAGAFSIDAAIRTIGLNWWPDEELSYDDLFTAIDVYEARKPRIMLSHECPESVVGKFFSWYRKEFPSRTREALDSMLAIHRPDVWIFGHWHMHIDEVIDGTRFICLNELQTLTIDTGTLKITY